MTLVQELGVRLKQSKPKPVTGDDEDEDDEEDDEVIDDEEPERLWFEES
jgi:hypothetical protein